MSRLHESCMVYRTNRNWLPPYCNPDSFLPMVQETRMVFKHPPYLFRDFVGLALAYLQSDTVRKMGFEFDPAMALPCKWKCSDESLFGVDLAVYAYTGQYPFDKGLIGGLFNEGSVGAAVHHSPLNVDFGGSHVGYTPGPNGGEFGYIARPLHPGERSTDCGAMMALLLPFKAVYDDAAQNILLFQPEGGDVIVSVPNEFLQPSWSSHRIKLMVAMDTLVTEAVAYDPARPCTQVLAGRSLFRAKNRFLDSLSPRDLAIAKSRTPTPIGRGLSCEFFDIFDTQAEIAPDGVPKRRILPYVKYILSAPTAPMALKAAVTNTNIEYNRLTDRIRAADCLPYAFASFTGVFIDIFDERNGRYVNLFQPLGVSIKPAHTSRMFEIGCEEVHSVFEHIEPVEPVLSLRGIFGHDHPDHVLDSFTFSRQ